jgi:hypothetical protein
MKKQEIDFWRGAIENTKVWMRPRHKLWKRLLKAYEMDFEVAGLPEDKTVRISRFYPLTRQIIASISYTLPSHIGASSQCCIRADGYQG